MSIKKCFEEMPCTLKLAYVLIAILFVINIAFWVGCCMNKTTSVKGGSASDKEIADWVYKNPETILDSVNKYAAKQQEEIQKQQQKQAAENIGKFDKELKNTKYAGVMNPKGKIEIVEFYDYNCGYCKMAAKNIEELLKTRKDVRVILRSIPILGDASVYASQVGVAILITEPAKYPDYYKALMGGSARNKEGVAKAVETAGIKMAKIEKVLTKNKAEIEAAINKNQELARNVGINGTPAFIVNGELIPGAVDAKTLDRKIGK